VAIAEIFLPLSCGARLVLAAPGGHRDSGYLAELAARHRITVMVFVPSALDVFLLEPAARALPDLRLTMVAGEVLVPALVDRFRALYDAELVNLYGPSECSIYATAWTCPADPPFRPVTIGRPGPEVIAVVADEHGAAAETGELFLGGPCVGDGYLGRPELDARSFVADPTERHPGRFYRTGDLVRVTEGGELEFLGRIDNQLKFRGFRVELGEIVSALLETFDLARAAVLPAPSPDGGVELHAFVVPRQGRQAPTGAATALAGRLPDYMIPVKWHAVDSLPLSPNGKLDTAALLAGRPAADTVAGDRLANLWRRATGLPTDDPDANLFELGGNSLTAARLLAFARAELGVDLRLDEFAAEPTLAALARARTARVADDLRAAARPAEGHAPLHPAQRRLWTLEQVLPGSPAYNIVTLHRIRGPLSVSALAAAVHEVIARHEPLRTTFHGGPEGPRQVISPSPTTGLVWSDLTAGEEWVAAIARTRFDVTAGPLLRVELAPVGPDEYRLVWCLHHLIADGWSLEVLWDDLAAAYQRQVRPDPVRYGDVASWAAGQRRDGDLDYWREHLGDAPVGVDLPWLAANRGPRSREHAGRVRLPLAASDLDRAARRERVTAAAMVLTAYAVVLSRWSGQDDLVIGAPLAGRHHPALDDVVGFFNSTVVLRARLAGCRTGRDALLRMAAELIDAQSHDVAPYDEVVAALGRGGSPLFDVWFNVFNYLSRPLRLPGLEVEALAAPLPGALFDLGLYVYPDALELIHDTERLDTGHATALVNDVHDVLTALVDDPDRPLWMIDGSAPNWSPLPDSPGCQALVKVVDRHEHRHPELIARSRELAGEWRSGGVGPGTVVPILGEASIELPAAVLAARRLGAAFAILDPAHPPAWRAAQQRVIESAPVGPDVAYVMFTSGSTAAPRAVTGSEEPVTAFLQRYTERFSLTSSDVFCLLSGYGHDPVLRDLLTPLWTGGRLEFPAPEVRADPARLLVWLADSGITVLHVTPLLADLLIASGGPVLPSVRLTCFGGDALPGRTVRGWRKLTPNSRVVNFYGCTETPQAGTWHEVRDDEPVLPVGASGPSGQLIVLRADGRVATVGQVGEICWRGRLSTLGYLGDPDATASRYRPDPAGEPGVVLVRTGDRGRLRPDGLVRVLGRGDGEVKIRGHRVDPSQLEAVLTGMDGVRGAAVLVVSGRLAACVVPAGPLSAPAVRDHLRGQLPAALVPELVLLVDELPLTPNGKLDRARLSELVSAAPAELPPASGMVAAVRAVWREVLGARSLDDNANFFDLGATSLTLLQAHARLSGTLSLGHEVLPVIALFEHCTVTSLAAHLDTVLGGARQPSPSTRIRRGGRHDQERAVRRAAHRVGVRP
jgi:non-ribosomal peptide synthetase component F